MPTKSYPVAAVAVLGCAKQAPGLLATLIASAEQEHQRAAGAWHAEWQPYGHLLQVGASAAFWGGELLPSLEVDAGKMAANLTAAGGLPLAERVSALLRNAIGAAEAHDLVATAAARAATSGVPLRDILLASPDLEDKLAKAGITQADIDQALDPAGYLGAAADFADAALAAHEDLSW
jgi:3-carboxy-cis,cis-muconate cycloisomerase